MKQQGFSVIEVLLSLMLVSSMILALIQQQQQSKQLLNQFIIRAFDASKLDQLDENRIMQVDKIPIASHGVNFLSTIK